jgi:hypothetical protein
MLGIICFELLIKAFRVGEPLLFLPQRRTVCPRKVSQRRTVKRRAVASALRLSKASAHKPNALGSGRPSRWTGIPCAQGFDYQLIFNLTFALPKIKKMAMFPQPFFRTFRFPYVRCPFF